MMKAMTPKRTRSMATLVAALAVAMLGLADPAAGQAVDMTGTWNFEVDVQGQVTNPTVTFEQDGDALTGQYSSETLGQADVSGTVEGREVSFSFDATMDAQGQQVTVTYSGTVDEDDVFSGSIDLMGQISGSVTGTREM